MTGPAFVFQGPMLWVLRIVNGSDRFGDADYQRHHQIGPAAAGHPHGSAQDDRQEREVSTVTYTVPPDSDVLATDRVEVNGTGVVNDPPNGAVYAIDSVRAPRNPFTGWAPLVQIKVKAVQ